jgi:hypothetical protein
VKPKIVIDRRIIDTPQAAEYLGFSETHLKQLRARGGGPKFISYPGRSGRRPTIRYRIVDLDEWEKNHEIDASQPIVTARNRWKYAK